MRLVRHNLVAAGIADCRIVVGCSGGPDSTALLLALSLLAPELRLGLHVVAIDHGLRPEARVEAEAVCQLAGKLGLAAERASVVVPAGASRQAQARSARYQALAECAGRCAARFIAVGHTRDDQTETVLMRLLGGAGLTGLAGMALTSPLPIELAAPIDAPATLLRPLLTVARAQVESFLQPLLPLLAPLPFHDPSNGDPRYLRARLRRDVLPLLRELAPHLDDRILHLAEQLRADAEHLESAAGQALQALLSDSQAESVTLPVAALASLPRALQARVLHRAARIPLGQRHLEALMGLCRSQSGAQELNLPTGLHARRQGGLLTLRWPHGRPRAAPIP